MDEARCRVCKKLLSGLKGSALTCSAACRQRQCRISKKAAAAAVAAFEALCDEAAAEATIVDPARNGATKDS